MSRPSRNTAPLPDPATMSRHAETAAEMLRAIANPHRLLVLCVLGEGEASVSALNERIPLSQSALSQHLAVLRADGLVETRREAQTIHYRIVPGPALDVIRVLHAHFCAGKTNTRKKSQPATRSKP